MKKRINIDGEWFVSEDTHRILSPNYDIAYSYEASSGIFDYTILLNEVDDNQRLEIDINNGFIIAYINGRDKDYKLWDNMDYLRDVRDGIYRDCIEDDLTTIQLQELQNLLIAVTEKGWL